MVDIITPYMSNGEKDVDVLDGEETLDDKNLRELPLQQDAMEREMHVSQQVQASTLEELNMADNETEPRTMLIAKEMQPAQKIKLTELLQQYKDVFVRSFKDMKGLDSTFC